MFLNLRKCSFCPDAFFDLEKYAFYHPFCKFNSFYPNSFEKYAFYHSFCKFNSFYPNSFFDLRNVHSIVLFSSLIGFLS